MTAAAGLRNGISSSNAASEPESGSCWATRSHIDSHTWCDAAYHGPERLRNRLVGDLMQLAALGNRLRPGWIDRQRQVPRKVYDGYLANRLGLQVARYLYQHARRFAPLRRHPAGAASEIAVLRREGILIVPDFLPPAVFDEVRTAYDAAMAAAQPVGNPEGDTLRASVSLRHRELAVDHPVRQWLLDSDPIRQIVCGAAGLHRSAVPKSVSFDAMRGHPEGEYLDPTKDYHQDTFHPVFKAWLYIDEIGPDNGAMWYAKYSHRFSWARIRHEYRFSVHNGLIRRGKADRIPAEAHRGDRLLIPPRRLRDMGAVEMQASGAANTLVIANTHGFHRRGSFLPGRIRRQIHWRFRYLDL